MLHSDINCTRIYVTLSALQHSMFCPRQCALIHNEQLWRENALTTMGKIEHERVDEGRNTRHGDLLTARSVALICHHHGIRGTSDVVEYLYQPDSDQIIAATPVEYKHGREKIHRADAVQLCAQALCLEEMHDIDIPKAYLYYQQTRRRLDVPLDSELRRLTEQCIIDTRELLSSQTLPPAQRTSSCKACSLESDCLPQQRLRSASQYNEEMFGHGIESIDSEQR